ncbi:hypothetical protein H2201_002407 [Coniosporium apollinis]|uniref:HMG box domain-containing protein n=2 Tax=Coniosporium TaxID=2810619 RepID=A0ABQ9P3V7_9PEZI|nr:hypothetical protein H2199_001828 [Cladosporium sp. JES 115]KAJ9667538.1 hypothetical protein H2201_002407 [Coniosporium apollinis]
MLARGLVGRLAADVTRTPTHDLAQLARLVQRVSLSHNASSQALPRWSSYALPCGAHLVRRSYATAVSKVSRTKSTGTQTADPPVKRAYKKRTASTTTPEPGKAATPRKSTGRPKKTAAPKKKPGPKKTKVKPKAKPKPKKRVPTERGQERAVLKKEADRIRELKAKALQEPKQQPYTAWNQLASEFIKQNPGSLTEKTKSAAEKYRNLTPEEREHYNRLANEAKAANEAAYKAWVESHTPEQIRQANAARLQLNKLVRKSNGKPVLAHKYNRIRDHRQVKHPVSAYMRFNAERHASGDLKGLAIAEASRLVRDEWNALSESEKQKYVDLGHQDQERYRREYKEVYGEEPHSYTSSSTTTTSPEP